MAHSLLFLKQGWGQAPDESGAIKREIMENIPRYQDLPGTPFCLRSQSELGPPEETVPSVQDLEIPKINIRLIKKEIKAVIYELEREFRMRKLLTNEIMDSETRVEKDLMLEMLASTRTMILELEAKTERFRVALESLEAKAKNIEALVLPRDIEALAAAAVTKKRAKTPSHGGGAGKGPRRRRGRPRKVK